MSSAANLEESVLLMLAEAAEDNVSQLGPGDMAQRFRPPVPYRKVEIAADHLVEIGHARAIEYEHATTDYRITQNGLKWVEEHFHREDDGDGNTSWTRRPSDVKPAEAADPSLSGIHIHNNFAPTQTVSQSSTSPDPSGPSAARAGWVNVWVAIAAAIAVIIVSLWIGGKFG